MLFLSDLLDILQSQNISYKLTFLLKLFGGIANHYCGTEKTTTKDLFCSGLPSLSNTIIRLSKDEHAIFI
jgi:hypothetical protein